MKNVEDEGTQKRRRKRKGRKWRRKKMLLLGGGREQNGWAERPREPHIILLLKRLMPYLKHGSEPAIALFFY